MRGRLAIAAALLLIFAPAVWASVRGSGASSGSWVSLAPSPLAREEVVGTRIGAFVYLAAGFDDESIVSKALERYDIESDSWTRLAPMPLSLHHTAAVTYRGDVYLVGGFASDLQGLLRSDGLALSILLKYDPQTNEWTELPAPPTKRGAHAAAVIGRKLYVAGGFNLSRGELASLEIYDFKERRWTSGPPMEVRREHVAGVESNGSFYVLGGRQDPAYLLGNLRTVERYNPARRRWSFQPQMHRARSSFSAVPVGDDIVVYGGEENVGVIKEVERFDPGARRWSLLSPMLTPRHAFGAVSRGRRIYAFEGSPVPRIGISRTSEALDVP